MPGILSALNKSQYGTRAEQTKLVEDVTQRLHEARDKLDARIAELTGTRVVQIRTDKRGK